ncbi:MAG TPA: gluconate 2-dehydrogenase subunit 3 family protein [Gemmatimonadaceae bacterium]|nr:gluconate 2-dehydrogenase subunit 3 family protein [Gemmatimonadaceae bacterium]
MGTPNGITRHEAIARIALLLGGTLAASTIAGAERAVWAATPGWRPRSLSAQQAEMVATIAEHIIPATDTPGARAAGVHRLVDAGRCPAYGELADRFNRIGERARAAGCDSPTTITASPSSSTISRRTHC